MSEISETISVYGSANKMIEFLKINDLALLDKAQIEFSGGFTVVTGETGAGKSVLLGALSILAGNRCPKEAIRKGADACRVEASLSFGDTSKIDAYLEENGVNPCEDGALVLSRAISREKSGRVFINGTLTSLSTLAGLGEFWIDFHGPGEPQKLLARDEEAGVLREYAPLAHPSARTRRDVRSRSTGPPKRPSVLRQQPSAHARRAGRTGRRRARRPRRKRQRGRCRGRPW